MCLSEHAHPIDEALRMGHGQLRRTQLQHLWRDGSAVDAPATEFFQLVQVGQPQPHTGCLFKLADNPSTCSPVMWLATPCGHSQKAPSSSHGFSGPPPTGTPNSLSARAVHLYTPPMAAACDECSRAPLFCRCLLSSAHARTASQTGCTSGCAIGSRDQPTTHKLGDQPDTVTTG
jgi:hypothetical protein